MNPDATAVIDAPVKTAASHGYVRYSRGCRCGVCRKAKADYMRDRRATARTLAARFSTHTTATGVRCPTRHVVSGITHGRYGYEERGCRCETCRQAHYLSKAVKP